MRAQAAGAISGRTWPDRDELEATLAPLLGRLRLATLDREYYGLGIYLDPYRGAAEALRADATPRRPRPRLAPNQARQAPRPWPAPSSSPPDLPIAAPVRIASPDVPISAFFTPADYRMQLWGGKNP